MGELAKIETFRKQLAIIETIEEIKLLSDATMAYQNLMIKQKIAKESIDEIGEFDIEVKEKEAEWLNEFYPPKVNRAYTKTEYAMPITPKESALVRRLKRFKEDQPDKFNNIKDKIKKDKKKPLNAQTIDKEIKQEIKVEERIIQAEKGRDIIVDVDFRLGDFLTVLDDIPDGSVDCIITDPPYSFEFIDCWTQLSWFASKKLKPDGFCIAYSGQYNLPEVMDRMKNYLRYYWMFALYHEGATQIVNAVNLMCRWKPVLIYQNGKKKLDHTFGDYFISEEREKDGHDWQQSKSGVAYLIEMFTNPGDLIVEPFAGSGTTLIVAERMGRNVIGAESNEETYNIAKSIIHERNIL